MASIVHKRMRRASRGMTVLLAIATSGLLMSAGTASAATKSIYGYSSYKSIIGVTVIKHWSTTEFSYTGTRLKNPHAIPRNDSWTLPPTHEAAHKKWWNYYQYSLFGSGCSSAYMKWVTGVPTPWGPVGSSISETHVGHCFYNGSGHVHD